MFEERHGRKATVSDSAAVHAIAAEALTANALTPWTEAEAAHVSATAQAELAPVCAVLGGVIGQEVVKFVSSKGAPIENYFALNSLTGEGKVRLFVFFLGGGWI